MSTSTRRTTNDWKVVIFDFDDTLFLKSSGEFIPQIGRRMRILRSMGLVLMVLTYNAKTLAILKSTKLDQLFDGIFMMENKAHRKSVMMTTHPVLTSIVDRQSILFFDNDPFNVYDMESIGITSFLVNPVMGLQWNILEGILTHQFKELKSRILQRITRNYNYIERTTGAQNLQVLDRLERLHGRGEAPPLTPPYRHKTT